MGLDMYLTKKIYIGANYKHSNVKGEVNLTKGDKNEPIKININRISYIKESVGYWRKANQIHKWFVENIQDGKDDCGDYNVSEEKLSELLAICKKIKNECKLKKGKIRNGQTASPETGGKLVDNIEDGKIMTNSHIAANLLPSASGFFFGGTAYDEYYMNDIDNTIEIIETLFKEKGDAKYIDGDIYYHSYW